LHLKIKLLHQIKIRYFSSSKIIIVSKTPVNKVKKEITAVVKSVSNIAQKYETNKKINVNDANM